MSHPGKLKPLLLHYFTGDNWQEEQEMQQHRLRKMMSHGNL